MNFTDIENDIGEISKLEVPKVPVNTFYKFIGMIKGIVSAKRYVIECLICNQDTELFGDGMFVISNKGINSGAKVCGCNRAFWWSPVQYEIRIKRIADVSGHFFLGFKDSAVKTTTKCITRCPEHGINEHATVNAILYKNLIPCLVCSNHNTNLSRRKEDSVVTGGFMESGCFHSETKFWRDETDSNYWHYLCGSCQTVSRSTLSSLRLGARSCECSNYRQKQVYINLILRFGRVIALKFGVANNSYTRLAEQNRKSVYDVKPFEVWEFPTKQLCWETEGELKRTLQCCYLSKEEFPDGWTETTWVGNLKTILQILANNGGTRKNIVVDYWFKLGCEECVLALLNKDLEDTRTISVVVEEFSHLIGDVYK